MKGPTWSTALVIPGAIAVVASACTVAEERGDAGSRSADAAGAPDTSTTADGGATSYQGGSARCPVFQQFTSGMSACDSCLGDRCCDTSTACFSGAENECASKVACWADCLKGNPDAGIGGGDYSTCEAQCAGVDATASTFGAWVTCVVNSCDLGVLCR
jgi:hypothetical protein